MLGNVCKDPLEGQPRVEATCVVSLINFNLNCRNFIFVTLPATKGNSNDSLGISCFFFFFFFAKFKETEVSAISINFLTAIETGLKF